MTLCVIWYPLYNLKNVKKTRPSVTFNKVGCFSRFLNCTNGTKSRKTSQIFYYSTLVMEHQHRILNDESVKLFKTTYIT